MNISINVEIKGLHKTTLFLSLKNKTSQSKILSFIVIDQSLSNFSINPNYLEGLLKNRLLCPIHRISDSVDLACGQRIFVSNRFTGHADTTGPDNTLKTTAIGDLGPV